MKNCVPLCSETRCVMPVFLCRQPRGVLEGRQGVSPIRPLCSQCCHKPRISHSAHRAALTPTACTPLFHPANRTHLHSGHVLLHLTMRGNTTVWHGDVVYQRGKTQHMLENRGLRILSSVPLILH